MNVCENCCQDTDKLFPCPCGLTIECPIRFGICATCWRTIMGNAARRHIESTRHPQAVQ